MIDIQEILSNHAQWLRDPSTGKRANLSGADLSGACLNGAYMRDAILRNANLSGAYLSGACMRDAILRNANLSNANLRNANLRDAILSGVNLRDAILSGANLSGAYLSDANLSGANLGGACLSGARLNGASLIDASLIDAGLSDANLSGANLSDANLSGANLSGANLSGANLSGANLSGALGIPGALAFNRMSDTLEKPSFDQAVSLLNNLASRLAKIEQANQLTEQANPSDKSQDTLTVNLTYFKKSGKFYDAGSFEVPASTSLLDIWDEVRHMRSNGRLPALTYGDNYNYFSVLVNVPGHPNEHPWLLPAVDQ